MMRAIAWALAVAAALAAAPAAAQGFNMSRDNDQQIQVFADDGIEWVSEANRVIAHGNAKAIRGTVTVTADTLTAYYRDGAGGNEIWRLDADGNVTIATPTETATGTKATYDLEKAIFVLRGQPSKLVTPTDTVTAKDTLEYWEKERMAVARGDALATSADKSIKADVLTAHFKDKSGAAPARKPAGKGAGAAQSGSLELQRADAYGHVVLVTSKEQVTGDRGDYNLESGIATVTGSVKLTRDGNELNGGYAHVNLNTGISKLFGAAPGGKDGETRAHGTFIPEKQEGEKRRAIFRGAGPSQGDSSQDNDAGRR
ncbi:MAG: LptA/OstA family protein [Bacteroidota bacterium]